MKKLLIIVLCLLGFGSSAFAADWSLPGITIVTRAQRGADESIRYTKSTYAARKAAQKTRTEAELKELEESNYDAYLAKQKESYIYDVRNNYLLLNYESEQKIDTVIYDNGVNHLSWPQGYHYAKNKIIVHHTAGNTSSFTGVESAKAYMREIYEYHTSKRGDIGYNFVIDPYGNIYEGRAGGDSVIGAHVSRNNTPSIGISLMGNFEEQKPTSAQIKSLTALLTAVSKKYSIDPLAKTDYHVAIKEDPYMISKTNYTIAGHRDGGDTACPGDNLYSLLPAIRKVVWTNLQNGVLVKSVSETPKSTVNARVKDPSILKKWTSTMNTYVANTKNTYAKKNGIATAKTTTTKVVDKVSLEDAITKMEGDISVLLYELSMSYTKWTMGCENECLFVVGDKEIKGNNGVIQKSKQNFVLTIGGKKYTGTKISISDSEDGLVSIKNYTRVSYAKIPRNSFYGSITFSTELVRNLSLNKRNKQTAVVNTLPFRKYIRGIAETNDSESPAKIRAMQLISKGYALFYLNTKNKHTSIPSGASYQAIDNPNSFQKYVGAGLEKTLKKYYKELETTENQIVTYKGYLPILPYFSCSAGFTRSGKDKWGWTDTPYLVSRIDLNSCEKFDGHGVGLSGKGAQYLALQGWKTEDILKYYYPGVEISTVD